MFKKVSILLAVLIVYGIGNVYYEVNRSELTDTSNTKSDGSPWHLQDRCEASRNLTTGTSAGPWYNTVSPNEAFASERTHTFPYTCNLIELLGQPKDELQAQWEALKNFQC